MPDNILIIGGGFAGFWVAVAVRRVVGSQAGVTMIASARTLDLGLPIPNAMTPARWLARPCPPPMHLHPAQALPEWPEEKEIAL